MAAGDRNRTELIRELASEETHLTEYLCQIGPMVKWNTAAAHPEVGSAQVELGRSLQSAITDQFHAGHYYDPASDSVCPLVGELQLYPVRIARWFSAKAAEGTFQPESRTMAIRSGISEPAGRSCSGNLSEYGGGRD